MHYISPACSPAAALWVVRATRREECLTLRGGGEGGEGEDQDQHLHVVGVGTKWQRPALASPTLTQNP